MISIPQADCAKVFRPAVKLKQMVFEALCCMGTCLGLEPFYPFLVLAFRLVLREAARNQVSTIRPRSSL